MAIRELGIKGEPGISLPQAEQDKIMALVETARPKNFGKRKKVSFLSIFIPTLIKVYSVAIGIVLIIGLVAHFL
jgi:hypothetical protein